MKRWTVHGPVYADRWWYVDDTSRVHRGVHRRWFRTRTAARQFAHRMNHNA